MPEFLAAFKARAVPLVLSVTGFESFLSGAISEDGFKDIPYTVHKRELLISGRDVEKMEEKYKTLTDSTGDLSRVTKERNQEAVLAQLRLAIVSGRFEAMAEEATANKQTIVAPINESEKKQHQRPTARKDRLEDHCRTAVYPWRRDGI